MRPLVRSRAILVILLLLGLSLELTVPIAIEPDHYLEHGSAAQNDAEERVTLHGEDGDHHHQTARLEVVETSQRLHCALCAKLGGSQALVFGGLARDAVLDGGTAPLADAAFLSTSLARGPRQPRAPPLV